MVYDLINFGFNIVYFLLLARVVLSWIPHNPAHPIVAKIYQFTEPILKPFRDLVPAYRIGLDLSPIFAFIVLAILKRLIFQLLYAF